MRREMQTVGIPVFQFGIFSENDLSFFAGPDFNFGGRVHTNQNLYLKQDGTALLTLSDRVTAVGEVIRARLANGQQTHNGRVRVTLAPGTNNYRDLGINGANSGSSQNCQLAACEGSVVDGPGSALNEPLWTNVSVGKYNRTIMNGRTGARRLDLPLINDEAVPVDLIRRPNRFAPDTPAVAQQRFYSMASLRILLSDTRDDLMLLPTVNDGVEPISLESLTHQAALHGGDGLQTRGTALGIPYAGNTLDAMPLARGGASTEYKTGTGSLLGGYIKIQRQSSDGTWSDVTYEILKLGFTGRRLSNGTLNTVGTCTEPNPDAVIRIQRVKDTVGGCTTTSATNLWPNVLYDAREGARRDDPSASGTLPRFGGVMHYVELDVNNLRRWLEGEIGTTGNADTMRETGYVVYFSDRRGNRSLGADGVPAAAGGTPWNPGDDLETGELGMEDIINPASSSSTSNNVLDNGEDVNGNGTLETYGNVPRSAVAHTFGSPTLWSQITNSGSTAAATIARANRAIFFRRALKVVNGARGQLPAVGTQGLTIASENPVYVQGNYNACTPGNAPGSCTETGGAFGPVGNGHVSAAVIADAVTLLSSNWNDIRSFTSPHAPGGRPATTTWYRFGVIAGKGLSFTRPTSNTSNDHTDFGTDGGAHNFLRFLESWGGQALHYRGSIISFYTSRQAVGVYKCCDVVYGAPDRGYNFDEEFLNPLLLPPRTPMFRDINTLTFRQLLRPTQ